MSLFVGLQNAAEALRAFQQGVAVTQNNVSNATTPGYARQTQGFVAKRFAPEAGVFGGVGAGSVQSARNEFAERSVQRQVSLLGREESLASALGQVQLEFDATGQSGIPKALADLFDAFSDLSVSPNDMGSRQRVIERAGEVAQAFRGTSAALAAQQTEGRRAVAGSVMEIQRLAGSIQDYNLRCHDNVSASADSGLEAKVFSDLEQLAELVDIQAIRQADGSFTVLAGGQSALVIGGNLYGISADLSSTPGARILSSTGEDITSQLSGGRLAAQLEIVNSFLPGYETTLDQLAANLADRINTQLAAGVDRNGNTGAPLFTYTGPPGAASTLSVSAIGSAEIAAAAAAAPGGNTNALDLAALGRQAQIGDQTFAGFYGQLAGAVGRDARGAQSKAEAQGDLVTQAQVLRQQESGVSLDEEAARLLEFQRSYEAAAQLFRVLDSLTETTIGLLR